MKINSHLTRWLVTHFVFTLYNCAEFDNSEELLIIKIWLFLSVDTEKLIRMKENKKTTTKKQKNNLPGLHVLGILTCKVLY